MTHFAYVFKFSIILLLLLKKVDFDAVAFSRLEAYPKDSPTLVSGKT